VDFSIIGLSLPAGVPAFGHFCTATFGRRCPPRFAVAQNGHQGDPGLEPLGIRQLSDLTRDARVAFLRNRSINLLNLHSGIHVAAMSGGGAFFSIYLLKSGVPVPGVLASLGLILCGRFVIRPAVIALAVRCGLRRMLVAGTLLSATQYPLLAEVRGVGPALAALVAVAAVGDTLYWTTYHAYFARLGDDHLRGHQIGVREAIAAVVGVASPIVAGWLLVAGGPRAAFGATGVVAALAALPILFAPEVAVPRQAPGAFRAALPGVLLFMADGWVAVGFWMVWQIALFVTLNRHYLAYGGAMAFAALVGAVGGMTLGRHIDAGHGSRAVWFAFGTFAAILVLRAMATGNAALAVAANALGAFGGCLYMPTLMTPVYTLAKRSPCTLRFHVATEGGWDIGGAGGLFVTALATAHGVPLPASILLSLLGVAAIVAMLRRYYGERAGAPAAAAAARTSG
jgi:MFS transporter, DHA1 family, inner membrane transport protein